MSFVSYAQAGEDVLLWRALAPRVHADVGFYIDVGAYDPDIDSVTRVFYERGWSGVNVEPVREFFDKFPVSRPRDVNLPVAVSDKLGEIVFHEIVGHQLGTVVDVYADRHSDSGLSSRSYKVGCRTLSDICAQYASGRDIHFLKVDVEGHEGPALKGMDLRRYRPWVLVVEATEPNRLDVLTHDEWDDYVIESGYIYAGTTLPNRYYVSKEHEDLAQYFAFGPDDFHSAHEAAKLSFLEGQVHAFDVRDKSDFIASCYEVLLGRDLESRAVIDQRTSLSYVDILNSILRSAEFEERVLAYLTGDETFPDGRFTHPPTFRQRLWAASNLTNDRRVAGKMEEAADWKELLRLAVGASNHSAQR